MLATFLPGFLSGLIILTREEMLFIIPSAYIAYILLYERRRRDFVARTVIFLITTAFTVIPWLLYSSVHFGDPFYSYAFYINIVTNVFGSTPKAEVVSGSSASVFHWILLGLWKELNALPAIFSLFGSVFLPAGIIFTIRKRAIWIVYLVMGIDMLLLAILLYPFPYELKLFPYRFTDVDRIIFSGAMPANVIVAHGIVKLTSLLSDRER